MRTTTMEISLLPVGHHYCRLSSPSSSDLAYFSLKPCFSDRKPSSALRCICTKDAQFIESHGRRTLLGLVFTAAAGLNMCRAAEAVSLVGEQSMENITASELAGFGVGALLLCATIFAPKVDAFISASQRSSLGMCTRCGDLQMIACSRCKGTGSIRKGGFFGFGMVDDLYKLFRDEDIKISLVQCNTCLSKGHMPCPNCSKNL